LSSLLLSGGSTSFVIEATLKCKYVNNSDDDYNLKDSKDDDDIKDNNTY